MNPTLVFQVRDLGPCTCLHDHCAHAAQDETYRESIDALVALLAGPSTSWWPREALVLRDDAPVHYSTRVRRDPWLLLLGDDESSVDEVFASPRDICAPAGLLSEGGCLQFGDRRYTFAPLPDSVSELLAHLGWSPPPSDVAALSSDDADFLINVLHEGLTSERVCADSDTFEESQTVLLAQTDNDFWPLCQLLLGLDRPDRHRFLDLAENGLPVAEAYFRAVGIVN